MNSQINYLIARERHSELVRSAEQARINQAHPAAAPSSPRWSGRWLPTTRRLRAARQAAAARQANPGPPQEGLSATHDRARNSLRVLGRGDRDLDGGRPNADLTHPDVIDEQRSLDKVVLLGFDDRAGASPEYRELAIDRHAATDGVVLALTPFDQSHGLPPKPAVGSRRERSRTV